MPNPSGLFFTSWPLFYTSAKRGLGAAKLRRPTNPLPPTGGRASKFLGYPKTQLATIKTNTLTDSQIVVYTAKQIALMTTKPGMAGLC
ncbi:hypothetical protein [Mucilaginibacter mallensis]|uniref:hypothetical protein n=1 Tax=Mucilaginibacter mallensis TaxID=652787 RepID=UPI000B866754|nr:hypothetical protein [Mucilaginibacter mallensis]